MSDDKKKPEIQHENDATDSRTLDEIEDEEKVPATPTDSSVVSPDEGTGRHDEDGGADPM